MMSSDGNAPINNDHDIKAVLLNTEMRGPKFAIDL